MGSLIIEKVNSKRMLQRFVQFYYDLYRDNRCAVPFLYSDEISTLSKDTNPAFEFCDAEYFLAFRNDRVVGRIAGIINHVANEKWQRKSVRFGWFDFIDDIEVSTALIHAVEDWGRSKGMTDICGPMGFDDMDREGMLIEGLDRLSTMYINYNYPYYPEHINKMSGFKKDNDYMEYRIKIPETTPEKFSMISKMISKRYNLHVHKFTRRELVSEGQGREIFRILNATYKDLYGYSQLNEKQVDKLVNDYIKKADMRLVTAVFDENTHQMIGFGITFPSFSRAMQRTHDGRLWPFGWYHLMKVLMFHKTDTVDLLLIGVLPEYRQKGANALIFDDLITNMRDMGFRWAEAMPQMETNRGVQSQWQYLESEQHRRHRCFTRPL